MTGRVTTHRAARVRAGVAFSISAVLLAACAGSGSANKATVVSRAGSAATSTSTTTTTRPQTDAKVGDKVKTALGNFDTVYQYVQPLQPSNQYTTPDAGKEFAAVDYEACLGPNVDLTHDANGNTVPPDQRYVDVNPYDLQLVMPDNTRIQPSVSAKDPALNDTQLSTPNECVRGWITFEVPQGTRPSFIVDTKTGPPPIRWAVG